MDVREKLVELLAKYFDIGDSYAYNLTRVKEAFAVGTVTIDDFVEFDDEVVADIADHLIANGVTVQEWISVKDRLPGDNSDVLAYMQNGVESGIFPASYYKGWWEDQIWNTRCLSVTHWMPLPQPPKGE